MKTLVLLTLLVSEAVLAGVTNGGGGNAVVCRDVNQKITSAELLDLYEAKYQYGLTLGSDVGNFETELKTISEKIFDLTKHKLSDRRFHPEYFKYLHSFFKYLPPGAAIKPIDDSNEVIMPANCKVEQAAYFKEIDVILVNSDIWEALPPKHQAALVIHEGIYQSFRVGGSKDSQDARKTVAYLFSTKNLVPALASIPSDQEVIRCATEGDHTVAFMTKKETDWYLLNFTVLDGLPVFTETKADIGMSGTYILGDWWSYEQGTGGRGAWYIESMIPPRQWTKIKHVEKAAPLDDTKNFADVRISYLRMDENYEMPTPHEKLMTCARWTPNGSGYSVTPLKPKKAE